MTQYKPRTKPFPHQSKATVRALKQRNHAVFFEPRLGKTKVALDWAAVLALKGELSRVLVLAPRIALDVWESELLTHFTYDAHVETFEEEWDLPRRGGNITTHFFLAGREETFRRTRDSDGVLLPGAKQKILEEWRPDAIIVDESHEYKRPGGRGAQDAWRLIRRLRSKVGDGRPYVLLLTGTPSAKGWRDLFAQFRIMDESILGTSASDFDDKYCVYGQGNRKYTIVKYRNLSRLQATLNKHSTSCTAEEAGLAGEISFQVLGYDLPLKVRRAYDEMASEFLTEIDGRVITAANPGVKRLRLLQLTSGYLSEQADGYGREIHRAEINKAQEWLSLLFEQGESVLVYGRFSGEVDALWRMAGKVGYRSYRVDGSTNRADRRKALESFKAGGSPQALVFQYQAGSRSLDLSTAAEILFATLPDGWVDFWQCLNRVRGPNQKRPVRITALCARGTVDRSVLYGLQNKEDIHRLLMRDPKRFLSGRYGYF